MVHRFAVAASIAVLALTLSACGSSGPRTVAFKSGPYRYAVPAGFVVVKPSFPGKDPAFLTTAIPTSKKPHSGTLITYEVPLRAGAVPLATLPEFDRIEQQFYRQKGATITPAVRQRVAGRPGMCWHIGHFRNPSDGLIDGDSCAIAGRHLVLQTCTYKPDTRAVILRGCRALRARLRVY
jgi:hypothetical protein